MKLFIFFLTFSLEVRVKAGESVQLPEAKAPLMEPAGCLEEASLCAVKTREGEKFEIHAGANAIVLDQGTSVIRLSADEARLVWGTIWVKAKGSFTVKTEYGDATVKDGEFWMSRTAERITVSATSTEVVLHPRGSNEKLAVSPGEENWVSRVNRNGFAETGVPKAIAFAEHIARWARLFEGKKKTFEKDVAEFHAVWSEASRRAAEFHQDLMNRKIASIESEKARRASEKKKRLDEERKLRDLFRKKVLDQED
jgi:hypothetical protein